MSVPNTARLSAIVPMLNEETTIAATIAALRSGAPGAEIVVVDGGSSDRSRERTTGCDLLIEAPRGRARQLNTGAARASGTILAFVHADTIVPANFSEEIEAALLEPSVVGGRFDVQLDDRAPIFQLIGWLISIRSRLSRSATGDQAIFVRRETFQRLGGFPEIDLCEDLEFARRLKRAGRVACLKARVITSSRRWKQHGVARTILRMWIVRGLYLLGVPPARLKIFYEAVPR